MKSIKKALLLASAVLLLAGCKSGAAPKKPKHISIVDGKYVPLENSINPNIGDGKRKSSLKYIFNTDSVGESEIYIKRSEWNKMLEYYDYFYKNENTVAVEQFTYKKGNMQWDLTNCGIRLRGNTSRYRPQGKDLPADETGHTKPNYGWDDKQYGFYHAYSQTCSDDDYRQSHFKVDFEPYDAKQKMAGCMKGVALKRLDGAYAREILCYDLFHENDVFSATRASHTKVTIYMIEEDNSVTAVDYGVYEMFEEVNDQFLKARDESDPNAEHTFTHWASTDGDLWKCGGNLTPNDVNSRAGVENINILSNGTKIKPGETKDKDTWSYVWEGYGYDLKTNKKKLAAAKTNLMTFTEELEALRNLPTDEAGIAARKAFYEKWFDMDLFLTTYAVNVAVGMDDDYWGNANNYYIYFDNGAGGTGKCFLIPFDYDNTLGQSINGDGVYNNPLDWGWSQSGNFRHDRPLMDRLLEVPEYRQLYKQKLLQVTAEDSAWSMEKAGAKVTKWMNLVIANDTDGKPLTYSEDLDNANPLNSLYWNDYGGWKAVKHYLNAEPNIYDQVRESFKNWVALDGGITIQFDFNGGTGIDPNTGLSTTEPVSIQLDESLFHTLSGISLDGQITTPTRNGKIFKGWTITKDGDDFVTNKLVTKVYAKWVDVSEIKDLYIYQLTPEMDDYDSSLPAGLQFKILNPPAYHNEGKNGSWRRNVYVDGVKISEDDNKEVITATKWYFPFVKEGQSYTIRIGYKGSDYGTEILTTNTLKVAGVEAVGDFKYTKSSTKLNFSTEGNIFTYEKPQGIYVGNLVEEGYTPGYFEVRFHDSNWKFSSGYDIYDYKIDSFDLYKLIMEKANYINWEGTYVPDLAFAQEIYPTLNYIIPTSKVPGLDSSNGNYRLEIPVQDGGVQVTDNRLKVTPDANGKYPGLTINLLELYGEIPEDAGVRIIYINNKNVSEYSNSSDIDIIKAETWIYPFVEAGKEYTVRVEYLTSNWTRIGSKTENFIAESGIGENLLIENPEYKVENNELIWVTQPKLTVAGKTFSSTNNPGKFNIGIMENVHWTWFAGKDDITVELLGFNFEEYLRQYFVENRSWNSHTYEEMTTYGKTLILGLNYEISIPGLEKYKISIDPYIADGNFELN